MEPRVYAAGARVYASLVIIVSAPVQRIGFWGFSVLVRTFGSGLGDCWDGGLGLGLGLDNNSSAAITTLITSPLTPPLNQGLP